MRCGVALLMLRTMVAQPARIGILGQVRERLMLSWSAAQGMRC